MRGSSPHGPTPPKLQQQMQKRAAGPKPPPKPSAASFQAPEGTHAKVKKRPSRLKRAYQRAKVLKAVDHWLGVLATVEEAMQAAGEAEAAIENEIAALVGRGNAETVRVEVLKQQHVLAQEQREQLLRYTHSHARGLPSSTCFWVI